MTAPLSPAPALTAEEAARVAVFDAAEEPEEVVVERVARAIFVSDGCRDELWLDELIFEPTREEYRANARAALAALRGDRG